MRSEIRLMLRAIALAAVVAGLAGCTGSSPDPLPPPADLSQSVAAGQPGTAPTATYVRPGGASATSAAPPAPPAGYQIAPDSLAWAPDGELLAYATRDGAFYLNDGGVEKRIEGAALDGVGRPFIRWSPDGSALLAGGAWFDGIAVFTGLWLVNVAGAAATTVEVVVPPSQVVSNVRGNTGAVHGADWSPDGRHFAYPYRAEAWLARAWTPPTRLTRLTDVPLQRDGSSPPFSGVRAVAFSQTGTTLALELSCDCGAPWSGAAVLRLNDSDVDDLAEAPFTPLLTRDGMTVTGWSTDGRIVGQNAYADWTPQATIDGYAVGDEGTLAENLTASNPGVDPLTADSPTAAASPMQTGPIEWDRGGPGRAATGEYLYELYVYDTGPVPHRGFATRSAPTAKPVEHIGSAAGWFVAPRWLNDGTIAYVEAEPGPAALFVLKRAIVQGGAELILEGMASAVAFSPTGTRLAVVESSVGGDDVVKIVAVP